MTLRRLLTVLPALTLSLGVACFDDKDDDDDDEDDDSGRGDTTWGTTGTGGTTGTTGTTGFGGGPTASVTWGASSIDLVVGGGPGAYWFGLAETAGCDDCWTGEDCVYGYDASGTTLAYCHDAGDTGTNLAYGGNPSQLVAGTTVFPSSNSDGYVTYYLESDADYGGDGSCYTWGSDPSYYDGLGCTVL